MFPESSYASRFILYIIRIRDDFEIEIFDIIKRNVFFFLKKNPPFQLIFEEH